MKLGCSYDGGNMASRGDVVVVNVNYRLGILGNMASASLNGSQCISKAALVLLPYDSSDTLNDR
jgi:acetylcholinesterase